MSLVKSLGAKSLGLEDDGSPRFWLLVLGAVIALLVAILIPVFASLLFSAWRMRSQRDTAHLDPDYFIAPYFSDTTRKGSPSSGESPSDKEEKETQYPLLSVIIPAFNELERLPIMLQETLDFLKTKTLSEKTFSWEILVVDDCSDDGTAAMVLREYAKNHENIRVIRLRKNQGKGFAVKVGMLSAAGGYRLMVDADGATRFSDLDKLFKSVRPFGDHDVVFGSRHHLVAGATARRAWYRNIFTYGLHLLVRVLIIGPGNAPIYDTQCGFKLFTREAALKLFPSQHVRRWAFDLELVTLAYSQGLRIAEIAVAWTEIPGSKLSLLSATVNILKDMVRIRAAYMLGIWQVATVDENNLNEAVFGEGAVNAAESAAESKKAR